MTFTGSVWTTLDVVGFHNWPTAPTQVRHLKDRHRHLFKIKVEVGVSHTERAVEFQLLQRDLKGYLYSTFSPSSGQAIAVGDLEFDDLSCESIAQALIWVLVDYHPSSYPYEVTVSEDGESGATVRLEADA